MRESSPSALGESMVRTSPLTSSHSADKQRYLHISNSSLARWRQMSAFIVLFSVIFAPLRGVAQSNQQEKRGIVIPTGPGQTSVPASSVARSDKPELILQTGHIRSANAVAFSPDNRWLASGGKDNVIKIWDLATGNVLRTLYGHTGNVNTVAVSPDGK